MNLRGQPGSRRSGPQRSSRSGRFRSMGTATRWPNERPPRRQRPKVEPCGGAMRNPPRGQRRGRPRRGPAPWPGRRESRHQAARHRPEARSEAACIQPIAPELGNPREEVNENDLNPQQPDSCNRNKSLASVTPGLEGKGSRQREECSQDKEVGDQPIVVEVGRRLRHLEPAEGCRKERRANAVMPADRYSDRPQERDRCNNKNGFSRHLRNPPQAGIAKVVGRCGVKARQPTVPPESR